MAITVYSVFVPVGDVKLYTAVLLPDSVGTFPVILMRTPYVEQTETQDEEVILKDIREERKELLVAGYAVVLQHCRGTGKSTGDFLPYQDEREDGLALQQWVREQPFYQKEIYLLGGSYTAYVHYATAPFAPDIKGAILSVMDTERYKTNYRNGMFCSGLIGAWYVGMYKKRNQLDKCEGADSFRMLPLSKFTETVLSEKDVYFDEILKHPDEDDSFWNTSLGGVETRHVMDHVRIPVLMITGFFDVFLNGMFKMWRDMDAEAKSKCALIITPYDHSMGWDQPVQFPGANLEEKLPHLEVRWFEYLRGRGESPCTCGNVTYYKLFGDSWECDRFEENVHTRKISLGAGEIAYVYNPYDPSKYMGGLTTAFSGTAYQLPAGSHYGIKTFYSEAFAEDVYIKGKITADLCVKSDCEDTCFYMRLSVVKSEGDYGLRDDVHTISAAAPEYIPGQEQMLSFTFDEIAILIHKGEKLRIDVSSSAYPTFVPHTNRKGLFSEQKQAKIAHNSIVCEKSFITLPCYL